MTGGALNLDIDDCDGFRLINNDWLASGIVRYDTTTTLTNVTNQIEDGYITNQMNFVSTGAASTLLAQRGWIAIANLPPKVIRTGSNPGTTGGTDTHVHQWYKDSGSNTVDDQSFDSSGNATNLTSEGGATAKQINLGAGPIMLDPDFFTSSISHVQAFFEVAGFSHR